MRSPRAKPVTLIARARRVVKKTWKAEGTDPLAPQSTKASFFKPRPSAPAPTNDASSDDNISEPEASPRKAKTRKSRRSSVSYS